MLYMFAHLLPLMYVLRTVYNCQDRIRPKLFLIYL